MVDDSALNLRVYRKVLQDLDSAHCVEFTSSADALAWSELNDVDVALIDYNMPQPDGLEVIRALRQQSHNADALVVMITALGDRDIRYRALDLGAADFLNIPIDPPEFRARVRNLLALSSSRKQLTHRAEWLSAEVAHATASIAAREREIIHRLTRAAEFRDNETGMHIVRMGHYSAELGRMLNLPDTECERLLMATPMHDIGKVATPDAILLKPGKLDPDEWVIMKRHTIAGYEILKGSESPLLQTAAQIAISHHEKFDGSGYPHGLKGTGIPLSGRICAVSDVFDALTSNRPYKDAWRIDEAVEEITRLSGTHFDPDLVDAFHRALPNIITIREQYRDER